MLQYERFVFAYAPEPVFVIVVVNDDDDDGFAVVRGGVDDDNIDERGILDGGIVEDCGSTCHISLLLTI